MKRKRTGDSSTYARRLLAPMVERLEAVCPRCRRVIYPGEEWDAGHARDLALHPQQDTTRAWVRNAVARGLLRPEHRRCNRSAGAALGNRMRGKVKRELATPPPARRLRPLPEPSRDW